MNIVADYVCTEIKNDISLVTFVTNVTNSNKNVLYEKMFTEFMSP